MDWSVPEFAHVPLIHGADGAKLSKRHGALGVDAYRELGYLPEALRNYLLRLGWSHGDEEIISSEQAIAWFDIDAVGRGPARFDFAKLDSLNGHYIRMADDTCLADLIVPRLERLAGKPLDAAALGRLHAGMNGLKARARTLVELANNARFYVAARRSFSTRRVNASSPRRAAYFPIWPFSSPMRSGPRKRSRPPSGPLPKLATRSSGRWRSLYGQR